MSRLKRKGPTSHRARAGRSEARRGEGAWSGCGWVLHSPPIRAKRLRLLASAAVRCASDLRPISYRYRSSREIEHESASTDRDTKTTQVSTRNKTTQPVRWAHLQLHSPSNHHRRSPRTEVPLGGRACRSNTTAQGYSRKHNVPHHFPAQ
jgi:hypothetical protein